MPARTVPKNYRNVTGRVYNSRTRASSAFESTLERDYFLLLDFDPTVEYYEEQPVTIKYRDSSDALHRYTPDVFIRYCNTADHVPPPRSVLAEVKYRDDLRQNWIEYKTRFKAARRYARERDWCFRLMTEREIRTPFLENVKFLRQYRELAVDTEHQRVLLQILAQQRVMDVDGLLKEMTAERWQQAQLLPVLWHLVAHRRIVVNLQQRLTRRSCLWLPDSGPHRL